MRHSCIILVEFLPLPLEVLRPLGAPAIGPPPRPVSRSTAALFTDMEKFLCKHKQGEGRTGFQLSYLHWQNYCIIQENSIASGLRAMRHLISSERQVRDSF